MYESLSIISLHEPACWDAAVQSDTGRAGAQVKALSFIAHCQVCWLAATFIPKVWTIWRLMCFPTFPVGFFYELGLSLFLEDLLFAKSPKLVYQSLPWADSPFDGV
jgi:hypothetical protein